MRGTGEGGSPFGCRFLRQARVAGVQAAIGADTSVCRLELGSVAFVSEFVEKKLLGRLQQTVNRLVDFEEQPPIYLPKKFLRVSRKGVCDSFVRQPRHHLCRLLNEAEISSLPATQKHFATSRRIGSPQARGRTAVADFSRAIETPPATKRLRKLGALPVPKSLTADVRARVNIKDSARTHCWRRSGL